MDIRFRAKKILGNMDSYVQQHDIGSEFSSYFGLLPSDILGVYINNLQKGDLIFVNEKGVAVSKNGLLDKILYSDIMKIKAPPKDAPTGITVTLKNGSVKFVPVANGRGQLRDVYEFTRF